MARFNYLLVLITISVFSISCNVDNEPIPDNVIESPTGLNIDLEWSTGGSAVQSTADVDLDLFMYSGPDDVAFSETTDFERVRLENFFRNGTYIVRITYFDGISDVNWTLYVGSPDSDKDIILKDFFSRNDVGIQVDYIEIVKNGTTYTINLL
ncbi:MAG: hypothetical protein RLO81_19715 [Fulvivirga sp.]|uniref:hypothetical protein n=1 Tax=Fulvivirga sp. TaxID=1931237 RepID=UPI0032EC2ADA